MSSSFIHGKNVLYTHKDTHKYTHNDMNLKIYENMWNPMPDIEWNI